MFSIVQIKLLSGSCGPIVPDGAIIDSPNPLEEILAIASHRDLLVLKT